MSSDSELRSVEFSDREEGDDDDDDIADTLQRSHMMDRHDDSDVQSFMLVNHSEELQVCITIWFHSCDFK